jgi:hypothetical protein
MKKFLVLPLVALVAACSGGSRSSSLSLSARAGAVSTAATTATAPAATGVSVTRIRVALRDIELRSRDGSKRAEITLAPVVIDLNDLTSAGVQKVLDSTVPAGTYDKIKFEIHRPLASDKVAGADDLVKAGASILIDGTFNGTPFQFATALEAEQELEGKFVIDATSQNITLNFDPSKWFLSGTTVLDPTAAANQLAIEENIRASLAAFQDDDESGHENHHGADDGPGHDAGDDHGGGGNDDGSGHH